MSDLSGHANDRPQPQPVDVLQNCVRPEPRSLAEEGPGRHVCASPLPAPGLRRRP
jgi:hypothetical protein